MAVTMWASSQVYVYGLNHIKSNVDTIIVSNTKPTSTWLWADFKDASSSTGLWCAGTTQAASSDWTFAAGTISGRKVTHTASSNTQNMTVSGPTTKAASVCLGSGTSSKLLFITTCSTVALSTSDQVTVPTFRIEVKAPTSS